MAHTIHGAMDIYMVEGWTSVIDYLRVSIHSPFAPEKRRNSNHLYFSLGPSFLHLRKSYQYDEEILGH